MKIIDFKKKGNVVRFYLGEDSCQDYWGDDWNDRPYEHNAGEVYEEYIKGWKDVYVPFEDLVLEPCNGNFYNSEWSKEDMKNRKVPCIIIVPHSEFEYEWQVDDFIMHVGSDKVTKYYFGDTMEPDPISLIMLEDKNETTK